MRLAAAIQLVHADQCPACPGQQPAQKPAAPPKASSKAPAPKPQNPAATGPTGPGAPKPQPGSGNAPKPAPGASSGAPQPGQPSSPQSGPSPQPPSQNGPPDPAGVAQHPDQDDPMAGAGQHDEMHQVLTSLNFILELLKPNGTASYFKQGNGIQTAPAGTWQHFQNGQQVANGSGAATLHSYLVSKPGMHPGSEQADKLGPGQDPSQPQGTPGQGNSGGQAQPAGNPFQKPAAKPPQPAGMSGVASVAAGGPGSGRHPGFGKIQTTPDATGKIPVPRALAQHGHQIAHR